MLGFASISELPISTIELNKFETLTDNFNDNTTDTNLWTTFNSPVETSGQLQITSGLTSIYRGYTSTAYYSLKDSYVHMQLVDGGNQALTSWEVIPVQAYVDSNNGLSWLLTGGTLLARKRIGGVASTVSSVAYNATTHAWLRIRESNGTIYYDYSADSAGAPTSWINFTTLAVPFSITNMLTEPYAGNYGIELSTTTSKFDNFNTTGTVATSTNQYLTMMGIGA